MKPLEKLSEPFQLNPGVKDDHGTVLTECVVRLLTRADQKKLAKEPDATREDAALARRVYSVGGNTERTFIQDALDAMALVDLARIQQQYALLEADCLTGGGGDAAGPRVRKIVKATDILSAPIQLNPGVYIDGEWRKTAIVRLLTRGEWKKLQAIPDDVERDDLALYFALVQLGDVVNVTPEHIDELTDGDVDRINRALEELAAEYAADTKSTG